jgi:hypothetical protein
MYRSSTESRQLEWRKARRSQGNGDCVEIASADGRIAVRDSKDPLGPMLTYPADAWRSFLVATKGDTSFN